ncbi:MAG TPA: sulfotransferase [Thermoanaerobaculia bacterium]|nr:sulfotransferase [Thermoanaerobaculia bacterium]
MEDGDPLHEALWAVLDLFPLWAAMQTILVTGMQRSGTTLLDKVLGNHPRISLLSQPFPLLFVEAKRRFLSRLGEQDIRYPLGNLFLESRYGEQELHRFLAGLTLAAPDLRAVFAEMAGFSGQYTRFAPERLEAALARLEPGDLASVLAQLYGSLAHRPGADHVGGKETLWEELLPFLLDRGGAGVVIVRDPRDVLASLNYGRGPEQAGSLKPTLFNVRNWRKSVAFVLHLQGRSKFLSLRYEDLIARPPEALGRITGFLGLEPFGDEAFAGGIRGQDGRLWAGNSSYGALRGIDPLARSRRRESLPPEVARYVEATCWPELRCLGYPVDLEEAEVPAAIRDFADPYGAARPELAGYTADPSSRAAEELRRWQLLRNGTGSEAQPYFLFEDVFFRLREAQPV